MKRRYKLLVIIFISFLLVVFIYLFKPINPYLYVAIGSKLNYNSSTYDYTSYINMNMKNSNYDYKYITSDDLRVQNIIRIIKNNEKNINNYLYNANLITICLDTYELTNYKTLDDNIKNEYIDSLNDLFILLKELTNGKIYFINAYQSGLGINSQIEFIAKKNHINYISLTDNNNYYTIHSSTYLNNRGAKDLANRIIK